MILNLNTGEYPIGIEALKAAHPNVSLPASPTDADLMGLGHVNVLPVDQPTFDPITKQIAEGAPHQTQAGWVQTWIVTDLAPATVAANRTAQIEAIWLRIKAERDRRIQTCGYKVGSKWYHSDTFSRSQQMGLVMAGAAIPANTQWKTMDGSFVTMTQTLAGQIFQAAMLSDMAIFGKAEALRAQCAAASDPNTINILAGWPLGFGE